MISAKHDDYCSFNASRLPDHLETTRSLRLLTVPVVRITQSQQEFSSLENTSLSLAGDGNAPQICLDGCVSSSLAGGLPPPLPPPQQHGFGRC